MPEPSSGLAKSAAEQAGEDKAENTPQKPKPQRIDLTPPEPMNLGYVGGVRVPKTNA